MTTAGKYTILRKIADGGMAEIFLAQLAGAKGFQKLVVLKRIRADFYPDSNSRNMLVDEAHVAMSLNHGNIVHVLDLGETKGSYFLAMELVEGWSVAQLVRRSRDAKLELPPEVALFIIAQTCRALAYAHKMRRDGEAMGIVHRDISPQNILVSEHGEVKLTDFGIAKVRNRTEMTAAGVVKGKIAFMSPEQAQGAKLDARSDLFSLGTVLYVLATDKLPFAAATDLESMVRIQAAEFPAPTKYKPKLKPELVKLILKAMRLRPQDRFQSAEEMLLEVEKVMRTAYKPAGQTELKQWLDELYAKDRVPPIHRDPANEKTTKDSGSDWAEVNESAIIPPTLPPMKAGKDATPALSALPPMPLPPSAKDARKPRRRWPMAVSFVVILAGAWWTLGRLSKPATKPVEPPAKTDRPLTEKPPTVAPAKPPPEISLVETNVVAGADAGAEEEAALLPDGGATERTTGEVADDEQERKLLRAAVSDPSNTIVGAEPDAGSKVAQAPPAEKPPENKGEQKSQTQAERPDTVYVLVHSNPVGAVVSVGDRVFGQTPILMRFRTGILFELTFVKSGYVTTKKLYEVKPRQGQKITAVLPKAGSRGNTPRPKR